MIIIRDKKFAFANMAKALNINGAGAALTGGQRFNAGLKSVGTMAAYGLGTTAVGAGIAGGVAAKKAHDIVKDDVDY